MSCFSAMNDDGDDGAVTDDNVELLGRTLICSWSDMLGLVVLIGLYDVRLSCLPETDDNDVFVEVVILHFSDRDNER